MMRNILFCGTPEFATSSLQTIFNYQKKLNYKLCGVVTIPDKPIGRGQKKQKCAIKKLAEKLQLETYSPTDIRNIDFIKKIQSLKLDLIIVVAFKKLPSIFFKIPKIGTINLHASLLPQYRGAAPINWVLINNEKETGLTTFFINKNIDTGDIILQSNVNIASEWHVDDLHDFLMIESEKIIIKTIQKVFLEDFQVISQKKTNNKNLKLAPKLKKENYLINNCFWETKKLQKIYNFIRGMSPPGIKTQLFIQHNEIKITKNVIITRVGNYSKTIEEARKKTQIIIKNNNIIISNNKESFHVKKLKTENGKELTAKDFLNGFVNQKGQKLTFF